MSENGVLDLGRWVGVLSEETWHTDICSKEWALQM